MPAGKIKMRSSRALAKMRAGRVALSTKINLYDPAVVEIAAMSGFDAIWLGMEHLPLTTEQINHLIRAAKIYDVDTIVRVQRGSYSHLVQPLEMDATAIMVPHLMSLREAKEIVYYTKFHPIGRRPLDGGGADGAYCQLDTNEYMARANRERFVIVQIEDPEPLDELEAIAALPGIDMLFFGPADFSQGIGYPAKWDHPEIARAKKQVAEVARKYGKFAGIPGSVANYSELVDMGYQFISIGADVIALGKYYTDIVDSIDKLEKR